MTRRDQGSRRSRSCTPIANKIGYPDKWRDYGALTIVRGDALGNSQRSNAFEFRRQLPRSASRSTRASGSMTPPTVNAYYNPLENNINFPAGILQPPFYSAKADAAVELRRRRRGHRPRADARLRRPGAPVRRAAATSRTGGRRPTPRRSRSAPQCFVDQYSSFTAVDDVKLNGKLTLGENAADNGGLRIALMAYLASLTPAPAEGRSTASRRSSASSSAAARVWCENARPERRGCWRRPTRTRPAAVPRQRRRRRTCRSSRRRSRARPTRRWCARRVPRLVTNASSRTREHAERRAT